MRSSSSSQSLMISAALTIVSCGATGIWNTENGVFGVGVFSVRGDNGRGARMGVAQDSLLEDELELVLADPGENEFLNAGPCVL
jgi:hypothetical protein